jgi:hypothetical protein
MYREYQRTARKKGSSIKKHVKANLKKTLEKDRDKSYHLSDMIYDAAGFEKISLVKQYPESFGLPSAAVIAPYVHKVTCGIDVIEELSFGPEYIAEVAHLLYYIKTHRYLPTFTSNVPTKFFLDIIVYYDPNNVCGIRTISSGKTIYADLSAAIITGQMEIHKKTTTYYGAYPGCRVDTALGALAHLTGDQRSGDLPEKKALAKAIKRTIASMEGFVKFAADIDIRVSRSKYELQMFMKPSNANRKTMLTEGFIYDQVGCNKGTEMVNFLDTYLIGRGQFAITEAIEPASTPGATLPLVLSNTKDIIKHFHPIVDEIFNMFANEGYMIMTNGTAMFPDNPTEPCDNNDHIQECLNKGLDCKERLDSCGHEWDYYERLVTSGEMNYEGLFWSMIAGSETLSEVTQMIARELVYDKEKWWASVDTNEIFHFAKKFLGSPSCSRANKSLFIQTAPLTGDDVHIQAGFMKLIEMFGFEPYAIKCPPSPRETDQNETSYLRHE